jgi:hypothetical protein
MLVDEPGNELVQLLSLGQLLDRILEIQVKFLRSPTQVANQWRTITRQERAQERGRVRRESRRLASRIVVRRGRVHFAPSWWPSRLLLASSSTIALVSSWSLGAPECVNHRIASVGTNLEFEYEIFGAFQLVLGAEKLHLRDGERRCWPAEVGRTR